MYVSIIIINMCYMVIDCFNYIMFIIVMVMYRGSVSYNVCMLYVLCELVITI